MTALLTVGNLSVTYPTRTGVVEAVRGISFELGRERLGIVGESGSGKVADRPGHHGADAAARHRPSRCPVLFRGRPAESRAGNLARNARQSHGDDPAGPPNSRSIRC